MIRVKGQAISYILFDLDETLYPKDSGLMDVVRERIMEYMRARLGFDQDTAGRLRQEYLQAYGTTSRGLHLHWGIDLDDYLVYVHDVPVESYLEPDPLLDALLARLDAQKAIFTNSPAYHVQRVLRALRVERHFSRIFDINTLGYVHKSDEQAHRFVLQALGAGGQECLLVDDLVINLQPGKNLGMVTVLVGESSPFSPGVDFVIPLVTFLEQVIDQA